MLFDAGRYEEALDRARRASRSPYPRWVSFQVAVASLIELGRFDEAAAAAAELMEHAPGSTLSAIRKRLDWMFPKSSVANQRIEGDLKKIGGLPE